jgi:hypothetical protein
VDISSVKDKGVFEKLHDELIYALKEVLRLHGLDEFIDQDLLKLTKIKLADKGLLSPNTFSELKNIFSGKKEFDANKLAKAEISKLISNTKFVIMELVEHAQRRRLIEVQKTRVRFMHDKKTGELIISGDDLFIIDDIEVPEKNIKKAFLRDGKITKVVSCTPKDFENALNEPTKTVNLHICESLIGDLSKIFKEKVKIII